MRKKRFSRGRWEIERHRCHIPSDIPVPDSGEAESVGSIIPAVVGALDLDVRSWLSELEREWGSLVGRDVARNARPGRHANGCLFVFVDNPAMLMELKRYGGARVLAGLQERFGKDRIARVSFQPDPDFEHRAGSD